MHCSLGQLLCREAVATRYFSACDRSMRERWQSIHARVRRRSTGANDFVVVWVPSWNGARPTLVKKEAMSIQPGAAVRAFAGPRDHVWGAVAYLAIGLAALLPRVLALGLFITDDEANFWLMR